MEYFFSNSHSKHNLSLFLTLLVLLALPLTVFLVKQQQDIGQRAQVASPSDATPSLPLDKKALLVIYDPLLSNGQRLHQKYGWNDPLQLTNQVIDVLRKASGGYLNYQVAETHVVDEFPALLDGYRYDETTYDNCIRGVSPCHLDNRADYAKMWSNFDICSKVSSGQIDEVFAFAASWLGGIDDEYAFKLVGDKFPYNTSTNYWLYQGRKKNIPDCNGKTVFLMGWNYGLGVDMALQSYGHRIENALALTVSKGDWYGCAGTSDFDKFSCYQKNITTTTPQTIAGCGDVHEPPNATGGYDWGNTTQVTDQCESFLNYPFTTPTTTTRGCEAWGCLGQNYFSWWMSHIPRQEGVTANGNLRNWWKYIADFDNGVAEAKGSVSPTPTPTPTPPSVELAHMMSPPPGSILPSSDVTFSWSGGFGISQYWLWVSTVAQDGNLYTQDQGTNLSTTVIGVPTDIPVYVRLWSSMISGAWEYCDYEYGPGSSSIENCSFTPTPTPTPEWGFCGDGVCQVCQTEACGYMESPGSCPQDCFPPPPPIITPVCNSCTADVTRNGFVTGADISFWNFCFNSGISASNSVGPCSNADINNDGVVDNTDLICIQSHLFEACISPTPTPTPTPIPFCSACSADTNGNGYVTGADISFIISCLGQSLDTIAPNGLACRNADTNGDGVVDSVDSACVTSQFGQSCLVHTTPTPTPTPPSGVLAQMVSPPPGSLPSSTVTFSWTSGSGVSQYWLQIGTQVAGLDLYWGDQGTALSTTVSGLPTDKVVYVRLWSFVNGAWQFNDYEYAPGSPTPTPIPFCSACSADTNGNGYVAISDLSFLNFCFGQSLTATNSVGLACRNADTNGDGVVDTVDIACVTSQLGQSCLLHTTPTPTPTPKPPTMFNIHVTPTATSATVTWNTIVPSTSEVYYGTTTSYGSTVFDSNSFVTSHSINLTGLSGNTLYHYRLGSYDGDDNAVGTTGDLTFTTNP